LTSGRWAADGKTRPGADLALVDLVAGQRTFDTGLPVVVESVRCERDKNARRGPKRLLDAGVCKDCSHRSTYEDQ
jgi:hypothetical protein